MQIRSVVVNWFLVGICREGVMSLFYTFMQNKIRYSLVNVRENRRSNQEWTIQRHEQH